MYEEAVNKKSEKSDCLYKDSKLKTLSTKSVKSKKKPKYMED